jgi:endonuclease/exonuclease/phosphatase family metal-dependent hydrolase
VSTDAHGCALSIVSGASVRLVPVYVPLRDMPVEKTRRTVDGLTRLRAALATQVPAKTLDRTMLLATWNIRELDSTKYGLRDDEAYLYLAEVVSHFDLVALQEVREDLAGLTRLTRTLGPSWSSIVTDVTEGRAGNGERMAFVYDTRTVQFGGLAGELVLPPLSDGTMPMQIARTPFMAGFVAGWARFQLATVHVIYGSDRAEDERRVAEIGEIASFLRKRTADRYAWSHDLVLLGDFNIYAPDDATMAALTDEGWMVPEELQSIPGTNVPKDKTYDQIALRSEPERRRRFETTGRAGVFDPFESVYRDEDEDVYVPAMGEGYRVSRAGNERDERQRHRYYREWRSHQISDHLPMWLEVRTDYSDEYLAARRRRR